MKTVTMLQLRQDAQGILQRVRRGERFVLSHRGRPVARLEPIDSAGPIDPVNDPFLSIGRRATPSLRGKTPHQDIDTVLYARS